MTAASLGGVDDRRRYRDDVRCGAQRGGQPVERCGVGALGELGREHERTVEPGAESVGHEVVGAPRRVGGGIAAGVGEREAHREQRDRQHGQDREATDERGPRPALDHSAPPEPHAPLARAVVRAAPPDREAVDRATGEAQQCGQQRDRGQHHNRHGQRRAHRHSLHEIDAHQEEAEDRDDDGATGEHDCAARGVDRAHDRALRIESLGEALPVPSDDEQRVVDAHADPDHRRELRGEVGCRDGMADELDERDTDADAEERDEDRQAHREQRAERDEQDHDGGEDADEFGGTDPGILLEHAPAQRDLRALDLLRGCVGQRADRVERRGRDIAGALVELHGCVGNSAVTRHLPRPRSRVRADDRAHARHLRHVGEERLHARPQRGIGHARRPREDDLAFIART